MATIPNPSPKSYQKYLKPGALAKLRDSKITLSRHNNRRETHNSLSRLLSSPSFSPIQQDQFLNHDNTVPCFLLPIYLRRPCCLLRRKLFPVTPTFTLTDTYQF
ncbi:unnamed protein product [Sphenostylis stenocarpa]|uniref:Uncharacterized protein n=1 Tax=Sphenostylis stenocarpa TaxID=92480 RepID=A0AA86VKM4_9FABA|nr:unnamed protein product [Sphenostylis stenocarpa]